MMGIFWRSIPNFMVDIHCHVLPGIDDGSPDLETSVAMCQAAVADGVTHIVGTPHCSDQYEFNWNVNTAKRDELQNAITLVKKTVTDFPVQFNNFRD